MLRRQIIGYGLLLIHCIYGGDWPDIDPKTLIQHFGPIEDRYIEGYTIPKVLFKTGPTQTCRNHPPLWKFFAKTEVFSGYKIVFFDDEQSRDIIAQYCPDSYLEAYDQVAPKAFKADIFRLVILYLCGGVYNDLTQKFLVSPTQYIDHHADTFYCVKDMSWEGLEGIHNAFLAVYPRHPLLLWILEGLVAEILQHRQPRTALDMTGPAAVLRHYNTFFLREDNQAIHFNRVRRLQAVDGNKYSVAVPFQKKELRYIVNGRGARCFLCKTEKLYQALFKNTRHYGNYPLDCMYDLN